MAATLGGCFLGSTPTWHDGVWNPLLLVENLQEVPGHTYWRTKPRTFPIAEAVVRRAHAIAHVIGECERRKHTPLSFQGHGSGFNAPALPAHFPADLRDEHTPRAGAEAAAELQALWDALPRPVQGDLLADWEDTGNRSDHPAHPFAVWGKVQFDSQP